ncbi:MULTISPECIES: hypothetical protein [unclassified Lentimicrobium]|nr:MULTISPECIES: hypothetical protein [unclassified Lentimicrobium]NPD45324.1 hypothetical protein [Lentimicrobium sp. S6]NPD84377.1 hypothetical protein [Lentimicrobium sp. L6]
MSGKARQKAEVTKVHWFTLSNPKKNKINDETEQTYFNLIPVCDNHKHWM